MKPCLARASQEEGKKKKTIKKEEDRRVCCRRCWRIHWVSGCCTHKASLYRNTCWLPSIWFIKLPWIVRLMLSCSPPSGPKAVSGCGTHKASLYRNTCWPVQIAWDRRRRSASQEPPASSPKEVSGYWTHKASLYRNTCWPVQIAWDRRHRSTSQEPPASSPKEVSGYWTHKASLYRSTCWPVQIAWDRRRRSASQEPPRLQSKGGQRVLDAQSVLVQKHLLAARLHGFLGSFEHAMTTWSDLLKFCAWGSWSLDWLIEFVDPEHVSVCLAFRWSEVVSKSLQLTENRMHEAML